MHDSQSVSLTTSNRPMSLHDLTVGHSSDVLYTSFAAADGRLVDLAGLQAIADAPHQVLTATLTGLSATDGNAVLVGMMVSGELLTWPAEMPDGDGTKQVPVVARGLMRTPETWMVNPGLAVLRDVQGRPHLVHIDAPTPPENACPDGAAALVLSIAETQDDGGARATVQPRIHFVPRDAARSNQHVVLAMQVRSGIWATDVQRRLEAEDPIIEGILALLTHLEHVAWTTDRHGWPWERSQQGREWSRYQTTATLALQATRAALMGQASTTMTRIRLLRNLHMQLHRSVEQAEQGLLRWMGSTEAPDPYRTVAPVHADLAVPSSHRIGPLAQAFQKTFGTWSLRQSHKTGEHVCVRTLLYAPLNAMDRDAMVAQFSEFRDHVAEQHVRKPENASTQDVTIVVDGHHVPLSDPAGIVDALVAQSGWQPY